MPQAITTGSSCTSPLPATPPLSHPAWRFPTYILFHPTLRERLEDSLRLHLEASVGWTTDPRHRLDLVKTFLRTEADALHRQHCRDSRLTVRLAARIAAAAVAQADHPAASPQVRAAAVEATETLAQTAHTAHSAQRGAQAAVYGLRGERGSKLFHGLAKPPRPATTISHLQVPGQADPIRLTAYNATSVITAAAHAAYSSDSPTGLFRTGQVDPAAQQQLLQHARPLSPELRVAAEGDPLTGICMEELHIALQHSANGKAAGSDGIPYEVYKVFWAQLGPLLLAAAQTAFQQVTETSSGSEAAAALPPSWREGLISLIFKGRNLPRPVLMSYRPITLLNCDFKLVSKAIGNRLQPGLASLVDPLQTAFLQGRDAAENVLFHQALIDWLHQSGHPGATLFLDLEKAYDRVHRPWLYMVAEAMNFGPGILRWLRRHSQGGGQRLLLPALCRS